MFEDENMALLTHELITAAERPDVGVVCEQNWSEAALERLAKCEGLLYGGVDVGRHRHWTVITVIEKCGLSYFARAILRIEGTRLPEQQERLDQVLALQNVRVVKIDMTGIGLGLFEYTRQKYPAKLVGVNFGTCVPAGTNGLFDGGTRHPTIRVTEHLATRPVANVRGSGDPASDRFGAAGEFAETGAAGGADGTRVDCRNIG